MSFRKPFHMPWRKLIPPLTLTVFKNIDRFFEGFTLAQLKNGA